MWLAGQGDRTKGTAACGSRLSQQQPVGQRTRSAAQATGLVGAGGRALPRRGVGPRLHDRQTLPGTRACLERALRRLARGTQQACASYFGAPLCVDTCCGSDIHKPTSHYPSQWPPSVCMTGRAWWLYPSHMVEPPRTPEEPRSNPSTHVGWHLGHAVGPLQRCDVAYDVACRYDEARLAYSRSGKPYMAARILEDPVSYTHLTLPTKA